MYNLDLSEGEYPIIIKPNLGQPTLINLRDFRQNDEFFRNITFDGYLIAIKRQSVEDILKYFHLNLYIQPILRDNGDFSKRRGEKSSLQINSIEKIKNLDFREHGVLEEDNCIVWDIFNNALQIDHIFGERTELYKITFQVKQIKKIHDLLSELNRSSLIFDIVHDIPNRIESRINYHSLAFFEKDWRDFKFIHASDFHIARRNDFISKFLKDKAKEKVKRRKERIIFPSKKVPFILRRDFEIKEEFHDEKIDKLRYAKYNFNYNLRLFIKYINERVKNKELDFILMSGDLVDYVYIARGNYQYKNNFFVLLDILLGINRGLEKYPHLTDDEYLNQYEILAPIFTLVGNHDYRKAHYSLKFAKARKVFGMTRKDVVGYYDIKFFNYFTALRSKQKYLRDYFRYFNPNLNFKCNIGNQFNFIFIETGPDSKADLHDLLKGGPSTTGVKDYQIDLLRTYIKISGDGKLIVVMHTPPLSPSLGFMKQKKFKRKFKLKRKIEWKDFYEDNLEKFLGESRVDTVLNLKYQTVMYNWAKLLRIFTGSDEIIRRKVDLIICGHTHTLKEFRLKEARKDEIQKVNYGYLFIPIHVKIPCKVYTSIYRDKFRNFDNPMDLKIWFDVNKPFIFQTQAIGPISLKYKFKPPGFRFYTIKDNEITNNQVYSLHLKEIEPKKQN